MLVDHKPTVLIVEDGVSVDRLRERVDTSSAVAAEHVRERDLGILGRDARRIEPDSWATVFRRYPATGLDLVEDRLGDGVARPQRVGELLAIGVQQHGS